MNKKPHKCDCHDCKIGTDSEIVEEHRMLNQLAIELNEKERRQFAGFLAKKYGYGGIAHLAEITGLHRATITRGQRELENGTTDDERIRKMGGGRHRIEKKNLDS